MKYFLCFAFSFFTFIFCEAQFTVRFKLNKYPLQDTQDSIFIAGNFNDWNPHNTAYILSSAEQNNFLLYTKLLAGSYEYKCTRGSWKKVECREHGVEIENHVFEIYCDTTFEINIEAWKDDFAAVSKMHTASKQVHVLDTAFFIPQLNRNRRIWIYLPQGYETSKKQYPVLYMQDGQNIFDNYTATFGEWGVDECLDSLIANGEPGCIVVGIDNGPQRMNEYNPEDFENFGKAEGGQYIDFLVQTLKPFIDKKYRTLSGKENTLIAGSSMGGLISFYAALKQPDVFGKAGIFSPSFQMAPGITQLTDSLATKINCRFFFYAGEQEGAALLTRMETILEMLGKKSTGMIYSVIYPEGYHNEKAWRKWFPEFYNWMMKSGFNAEINIEN